MSATEHALEPAVGAVTREPCKAARDCYLWATHYACWNQDSREGVRRRMRKPVCLRHARIFAAENGLEAP